MSTFKLTLVETIRYRGNIGHWSWVSHRVSGLAILSFLLIHVWDTANATFYPNMYNYTVEIFKWFPFSVGEIALMAAVLYHAFNGIRITLLDFQPKWWHLQNQTAKIVWGLFAVVFAPIGIYMFTRTLKHCQEKASEGGSCLAFPLPSNFNLAFSPMTGTLLAVAIAVFVLGGVLWFVFRNPPAKSAGTTRHPKQYKSNFERYAFTFMRLSGVALLLLAVGHMLLQHVFRDVHALNLTVVADIWRSWGWRIYDLLLLAFAVTHGLNGFRNILEDYIHNPKQVRSINTALTIFLIITIIWSAIAIFSFQPDAVMTTAP